MKKRSPWILLVLMGVLVAVSCSKKTDVPVGPKTNQSSVCSPFVTFGASTVGSVATAANGYIQASQYNNPQSCLVHNLEVYVSAAYGPVRAAIYTDASNAVGNLVVETASQPATVGWNILPVPATYLDPGKYWLALQVGDDGMGNGTNANYDPGSPGTGTLFPFTYGVFPSTFSAAYYSNNWSIKADTCPAITRTPTPTATP